MYEFFQGIASQLLNGNCIYTYDCLNDYGFVRHNSGGESQTQFYFEKDAEAKSVQSLAVKPDSELPKNIRILQNFLKATYKVFKGRAYLMTCQYCPENNICLLTLYNKKADNKEHYRVS